MNILKKIWFLIQLSCLLLGIFLLFFFTFNEMWTDLIKMIIYTTLSFMFFYLEIGSVIIWKFNRVFKYNDFN